MQSALIVHSKHTKDYAKLISKKYSNVIFLEVAHPPTGEVLKIRHDKDIVIGIGGGSVIDTAKIISKDKRCIAIPTTASGASMTPYATIWGKEKISVAAKKPILKMDYDIPKNFSKKVLQSTTFDALSHAIESFWSKNATSQSKIYSRKAICLINVYLNNNDEDFNKLIVAGNLAGQAIAVTKTNVVHAASYPITIEYGIDHGTACGILLPYFVDYMNFKGLPELFNLCSTQEVVTLLKQSFVTPKMKDFDIELIVKKIMQYDRIKQGSKKITRESLKKILKGVDLKCSIN